MTQSETGHQTWTRNIDFLFVTVGLGVGFGNVWRFPYICYKNGGGVFLIPYFLALCLLGIPVVVLEGSLGQFMSRGVIAAFKIVPLFEGLGYMIAAEAFITMAYFGILFVWVLYYLFASMTAVLPWSNCGNDWNTPDCRVFDGKPVVNISGMGNVTDYWTQGRELCVNSSCLLLNKSGSISDPASEFWERKVLGLSPGIDQPGVIKWDLALCLVLVWLIIYFCIWKGTAWIGKISYVTSTAPYLILFAMMIRGLTLDGSMDGIKYYLLPDWSKLGEGQVWLDACIQVLWSYGIGLACHTAMGSNNRIHHNIVKHYLWFALICSGTSFLCGFVIFSVLGFMAKERGVTVDTVATSGPGLAFVVYPQALAQMPWPTVWAIVFFLLLAVVAIDSEFASTEAIVIAILDVLPPKYGRTPYREIVIAVICSVLMLIGLSMVTEGGIYLQQLMEWYVSGKTTILVALLECVVVSYAYGANRFRKNLEYMLGYNVGPFLKYLWLFVTPAICGVMWLVELVMQRDLTYRRSKDVYAYPDWTVYLGWFIVFTIMVWFPGVMIWRIITTPGTLMQRIRKLLEPEFTDLQWKRDRCISDEDKLQPEDIPLQKV